MRNENGRERERERERERNNNYAKHDTYYLHFIVALSLTETEYPTKQKTAVDMSGCIRFLAQTVTSRVGTVFEISSSRWPLF